MCKTPGCTEAVIQRPRGKRREHHSKGCYLKYWKALNPRARATNNRPCDECAKTFTPRHTAQIYCSPCGKAKKAEHKRNAYSIQKLRRLLVTVKSIDPEKVKSIASRVILSEINQALKELTAAAKGQA